jgi:ribosome-binding factor A
VVSRQRVQRIADRIREELSEVMLFEVHDPRLEGVSITDVRVDRELAYADIYVSAIEGSKRADEILDGFEHASGYFRSELAKRVELRIFPRLRFHWDPTFEKGEHIDKLIASLHEHSHLDQSEDVRSRPDDTSNSEIEDLEDG